MRETGQVWCGMTPKYHLECKRPSSVVPPNSARVVEESKARTWKFGIELEPRSFVNSMLIPFVVPSSSTYRVWSLPGIQIHFRRGLRARGVEDRGRRSRSPRGDKLCLRRPNGQELKTTVVKTYG